MVELAGVNVRLGEFVTSVELFSLRTCKELALKILTVFWDELTRSDVSETLEIGGENGRRLKDWDRNRDKFRVLEMSFDGFQLKLGGLSESYREYSAGDKESAKNHWVKKDGKRSGWQ